MSIAPDHNLLKSIHHLLSVVYYLISITYLPLLMLPKPKKSLGQNFLTNQKILADIASLIPVSDKNIIEIGPGHGALTEHILAREPKNLELVELDRELVHLLREKQSNSTFAAQTTRLTIVHGDVLAYTPPFSSYSVIANIPYYITSPILFRFLYELPNAPEALVILMQKEVGDRIREKDGKHSLLSLALGRACTSISEAFRVGPGNFNPPPKVDSSVIVFETKKTRDRSHDNRFLDLLKKGFSAPRKKLLNNLSQGYNRKKEDIETLFSLIGLDADMRAEDGDIETWERIYSLLPG